MATERTAPTDAQVKAVASPIRLRILRRCLLEESTNSELAEWLGLDPSTSLYHVRLLVDAGLLAPVNDTASRPKPYRTTGLSWTLDFAPGTDSNVAMLDAFRAEVNACGPESIDMTSRFVLHLNDSELNELTTELQTVLDRYTGSDMERRNAGSPARGGFVMLHRTDLDA